MNPDVASDHEVAYSTPVTKLHAGVTKLVLTGSLCVVFRHFQPAMPPSAALKAFS